MIMHLFTIFTVADVFDLATIYIVYLLRPTLWTVMMTKESCSWTFLQNFKLERAVQMAWLHLIEACKVPTSLTLSSFAY